VEVVLGTDGGGLVVGRRMDLWLRHAATFPGLLYIWLGTLQSPSIAGGIIEFLCHHRPSLLLSPSVIMLSISTHDLLPSFASAQIPRHNRFEIV